MSVARHTGAQVAGNAASPEPGGRAAVRVDVVRDFSGGTITPEGWNALLLRSGGFIYGTHEWQSAWWESFGEGRDLRILRFLAGDELVGIAPLFHERAGGGRMRFIGSGDAFSKSGGRFLDDGPGDYLDFIVDPAHAEDVARTFWSWAGSDDAPSRIDLVNLRTDGTFLNAILPAMPRGRFSVVDREGDRCPFIPVGGNVADFLGGLRGSARRRYGQAFRLVDAPEAPLRTTIGDTDATGRVFGDLAKLHQDRWNALGFAGLFHDEAGLRFHRTVVDRFAGRGWVRYAALHDGADCVAARIAFAFGDRMYDYLSGFDETSRVAPRRPGLGLLIALLGVAHGEGLGLVDLLRGDEAYKFDLTASAAATRNITILGGGTSGRSAGSAGSTLELLGFLLGREATLFGVQASRHGLLRAIPRYAAFRTARFRNRFGRRDREQVLPKGDTHQ